MKRHAVFACLLATFATAGSLPADEPQVPKELDKVLRYYTGNWLVTGSLGDAAIKGKTSFRMPAG